MSSSENAKLVQMRLQPKTLERLTRLSELTHTTNKTQIISTALQLAEVILKSQATGGKIIIEKQDGTREALQVIL